MCVYIYTGIYIQRQSVHAARLLEPLQARHFQAMSIAQPTFVVVTRRTWCRGNARREHMFADTYQVQHWVSVSTLGSVFDKPCGKCGISFYYGYRCRCGLRFCSRDCYLQAWNIHRIVRVWAIAKRTVVERILDSRIAEHIFEFIDFHERPVRVAGSQ